MCEENVSQFFRNRSIGTEVALCRTGVPLVKHNNAMWGFEPNLRSWICVAGPTLSPDGLSLPSGENVTLDDSSLLRGIEASCSSGLSGMMSSGADSQVTPRGTISHLEHRIHAAFCLESRRDFEQSFEQFCRVGVLTGNTVALNRGLSLLSLWSEPSQAIAKRRQLCQGALPRVIASFEAALGMVGECQQQSLQADGPRASISSSTLKEMEKTLAKIQLLQTSHT